MGTLIRSGPFPAGVAALVLLVVLACGTNAGPPPAASGTVATPPAPSGTAPPVASSPTPNATADPGDPPPGKAGPVPASLASVIDTIIRGDSSAIRAHVRLVPTECGVQIECPPGVEPGTVFPIIRAMGCEPLLPNDLPGGIDGETDWFTSGPRTLLAVFEETATDPAFGWVPRGAHVVVVWPAAMGWASAFHIDGREITGIEFGCGHRPEQYYAGVEPSRFLIGPLPAP